MTNNAISLRFNRQPSPVLAEHRPLYKIAQLLLILHLSSRGGRSSLPRLHLFNWALKRDDRGEQLITASAEKLLKISAWGFDPALAIAIRYAISEKLIREVSTGYEITEFGIAFSKDIVKDPSALAKERAILESVGKGITETMVEAVAKGWETE